MFKKVLAVLFVLAMVAIVGCGGGGGGGGGGNSGNDAVWQPDGDGSISLTITKANGRYLITLNNARNYFGQEWEKVVASGQAFVEKSAGFAFVGKPVVNAAAKTISIEVEPGEIFWFKLLGVDEDGASVYPWYANTKIAEWVHTHEYGFKFIAGRIDINALTIVPVTDEELVGVEESGDEVFVPEGDGNITISVTAERGYDRVTIRPAKNLFGESWDKIQRMEITQKYGFSVIEDPILAGEFISFLADISPGAQIWFKILGYDNEDQPIWPWNDNPGLAEWIHKVDGSNLIGGRFDTTAGKIAATPDAILNYADYFSGGTGGTGGGGVVIPGFTYDGDGTIALAISAFGDHSRVTISKAKNLFGLGWDAIAASGVVTISQVAGMTLVGNGGNVVVDVANHTISFEAEIVDGAGFWFKPKGYSLQNQEVWLWEANTLLDPWLADVDGGTVIYGVYEDGEIEPGSSYVDNAPPTVASTTPVNSAVAIPVDSDIRINWGEMMDPDTITAQRVTVTGAVYGQVEIEITTLFDATYIFPKYGLLYGETYTVRVDDAVTDMRGNQMGEDYIFNFSTPALEVRETWSSTFADPLWYFYNYVGTASETGNSVTVDQNYAERWHVFQKVKVAQAFDNLANEASRHVIYRVILNGATYTGVVGSPPGVAFQLKENAGDYTVYDEKVVPWNSQIVVDLEQDPSDLVTGISLLFGKQAGTYNFIGSIVIQKCVVL